MAKEEPGECLLRRMEDKGMSKSLKSMEPTERKSAIQRRIRESKGGLGYWAARVAEKKGGKDK